MDRYTWDAAAHAGVVAARALTVRQDIILRRAIDQAYLTELPLPLDAATLLRLLRLPPGWTEDVGPAMSARFTLQIDAWVLRDMERRVRASRVAKYRPRPIAFDAKNIQWVGISETQAEAWQAAYPSVDIHVELARAAAWAAANPAKQDWGMFLVRWLSRASRNVAESRR